MDKISNFVFMLKTYRNDKKYVERLITSFEKYNVDHIPLFIVVPHKDYQLFLDEFGSERQNITVIEEEELGVEFAEEAYGGISAGYLNQEIVKLSFWKMGVCKNYMCIDSETYFIRNFTMDEFMYDEEIPYSVLIEDNDLKANPMYYNSYWIERAKKIHLIQEILQYNTKHLLTCHGAQIFNCMVLEKLESEFMIPCGYNYLDLIKLSPYEFSWYNIWLQKTQLIPIHVCEPFIKMYHMAYQQFEAILNNVNEDELSRSYVGVVINSNYTNGELVLIKEIERSYRIENNPMLRKIIAISIASYIKWIKDGMLSRLYRVWIRFRGKRSV